MSIFNVQEKGKAKESKRVMLTKRLIKDAVVELLKRGDESLINVRSICEEAEINRSTFYVHYKDKDELLHEMILDTVQKAQKFTDAYLHRKKMGEAMEEMLRYYCDNSSFFLTLMKTDYANEFIRMMTKTVWKVHQEFSRDTGMPLGEGDEYRMTYKVAGSIFVISKWLDKETPESVSTVSNYLLSFILGKKSL